MKRLYSAIGALAVVFATPSPAQTYLNERCSGKFQEYREIRYERGFDEHQIHVEGNVPMWCHYIKGTYADFMCSNDTKRLKTFWHLYKLLDVYDKNNLKVAGDFISSEEQYSCQVDTDVARDVYEVTTKRYIPGLGKVTAIGTRILIYRRLKPEF